MKFLISLTLVILIVRAIYTLPERDDARLVKLVNEAKARYLLEIPNHFFRDQSSLRSRLNFMRFLNKVESLRAAKKGKYQTTTRKATYPPFLRALDIRF